MMNILRNKNFWTALFWFWIIALVLFTSISFSPEMQKQNEGGFRFDYLEHYILYAVIPILYTLARGAYLKILIKDRYYIILLGILFSLLTEIQQHFISGRSFNPIDLILNLAGFLSGLLVVNYVFIKSSQSSDQKQ